MKKQKNHKIVIFRNSLFIPLFLAIVIIVYFVGRGQSVVSNSTATPAPSQTQFAPSATSSPLQKVNTYQIPTSNKELSLEERQKLGNYKAQIEEALRKGKEREDNLRKQIDDARKQCDDYTNTKDECLASIKDMEAKLGTLIQEDENNAYPLRQKLAEINALLGISN